MLTIVQTPGSATFWYVPHHLESWSRMASFLLEIIQPDCDVSTWTTTVRVVAYHVEKRVVAPECRVDASPSSDRNQELHAS